MNGQRIDVDAAVIGGGHNGLTCAAYLAEAGHSVVVLERGDRWRARHDRNGSSQPTPPGSLDTPTSSVCLPPLIVDELGLDLTLLQRPGAGTAS